MTHGKKITLATFVLLACFILAFQASHVLASTKWVLFRSETGTYSVRIPNEYKTHMESLRTSPAAVIHSEELIATDDQRPYKNAVRNHIVKIDQTFGHTFDPEEAGELISKDLDLYITHYRNLGAALKKVGQTDANIPTGELYMTYEDPELGLQGVRIRIRITDTTRYQQILTGPDKGLFGLKAKSFFEDIKLSNRTVKIDGKFEEEWNMYTSPLGIFTSFFPPATKTFTVDSPLIEHSQRTERISYTFKDPVRQQNLYYRIYGYRSDIILEPAHMKTLLVKRHIEKYGRPEETMQFLFGKNENDTNIIQTSYSIAPPEDLPYVSRVKLFGMAYKNYMLVHEIMGSPQLVDSPFTRELIKLTRFHPEKAHESYVTEEKKPGAALEEKPESK